MLLPTPPPRPLCLLAPKRHLSPLHPPLGVSTAAAGGEGRKRLYSWQPCPSLPSVSTHSLHPIHSIHIVTVSSLVPPPASQASPAGAQGIPREAAESSLQLNPLLGGWALLGLAWHLRGKTTGPLLTGSPCSFCLVAAPCA